MKMDLLIFCNFLKNILRILEFCWNCLEIIGFLEGFAVKWGSPGGSGTALSRTEIIF